MDGTDIPGELLDHLTRTSRLTPDEARRLTLEVLSYFSELPEEFVTRRHNELRRGGLSNASIYERIATELVQRRFAAPQLTERQIRRLIYG